MMAGDHDIRGVIQGTLRRVVISRRKESELTSWLMEYIGNVLSTSAKKFVRPTTAAALV